MSTGSELLDEIARNGGDMVAAMRKVHGTGPLREPVSAVAREAQREIVRKARTQSPLAK
jgi:hypothetical protein